jgi:hypothetical protein
MISLPDLLLPKAKYFGLSIERTSIHAIELNSQGEPIRLAEIKIPTETFIDGVLVNTELFIASIKNLVKVGKFSTPYVAICFPEVFAFTRGYILPIVPLDEVNEAIAWHARDLFPFPEQDIYFDWKILKKNEKDYQTMVVAVQKKLIDPMLNSLVSAGLKPLRFEPDASAMARLLILKQDEHALLVDINPQGAYVTLVEGEKALFTTVVNNGNGDTPTMYLANIDQTLKEIATFYKNKGILVDNSTIVVVTGEMASNDWVLHLNQLLNYPAGVLKTKMENSTYNKAYAAASQIIAPPLDDQSINLLPATTQNLYDSERDMLFYKTLLGRICFMVAVLVILSFVSYMMISFERQRIDTNVKTLRKSTETQQANTQNLLLLNSQAKNVVALAPFRKTVKDKLIVIQGLLNEKIIISGWDYDDSKLQFSISGIAQTREDLLAFKGSLDKTPDFTNINLPLGTLEIPLQVPFTITFLIKQ